MKKQELTPTYRPLLAEAWHLTWHRKSLWVFGLFAAIISTGGMFEITFRGFKRVEAGRTAIESMLNGTFPGFDGMGQYLRQLVVLPQGQVTFIATLAVLAFIALAVAGIVSQASLVAGAASGRELSLDEAVRKGRGHFWGLLGVNLLAKAAFIILLALTTLPIVALTVRDLPAAFLLHALLVLVFFLAGIAVNVIAMFAVIETVLEGAHPMDAIHAGVTLFRDHWLATIEYGVILFASVLIGGLALFTAVAILSIPFAILLILSLFIGSPFLFAILNALGTLAFFTILFSFIGASVTFQYAGWLTFYHRALHGGPKLLAKLHRLWAKR